MVVYQKHRANKKEPLAAMLRRIPDGFAAASLTPEVTATFADGPDVGGVSAVNRALKKYPDLDPVCQQRTGNAWVARDAALGRNPIGIEIAP